MNKKNPFGLSAGTSSLLVIFIILCLVTFASLSYVSARADYRLSIRTKEHTDNYYDASGKAQLLLAQADKVLLSCYEPAQNEEAYYALVFSEDSWDTSLFPDSLLFDEDARKISWTVPASDSQVLLAVLEVTYPQTPDEGFYQILTWQLKSTADWEPDNTIHVITFE